MTAPAAFPVRLQPRGPGNRTRKGVLFVIPGSGHGSSMIFARRQARSLAAAGVDVSLFHLGSRTSPWGLIGEFQRFRAEVSRLRPAAVHAHFGTVTALFCALACGSIPLVITYRGGDLNPAPACYGWPARLRAAFGRLFSQLAALKARRIVCVSGPLRERLWWRRQIAAVLPTGVDPQTFKPAPRLLARQRLGWSVEDRVVLFNAGHDAGVKRLDLAREAVDRARRGVACLRMEALDGSVPPERIPDMMNAADCLLLTSDSEGSPTVVQEALASNLPVVSVDVGDVAERIRDVRESTIAAADADALAQALIRMVEPPRRSNGRAKLREFSAPAVARALKSIYEELR